MCASIAVHFDEGTDWLTLALPVGALGRMDRRVGGYPFGSLEDSLEWRAPVDDWLERVAEHVFARVPFEGGLIGMEYNDAPVHHIDDVPEERWRGYLVRELDELMYFPATH